jgi:hypothetical protein
MNYKAFALASAIALGFGAAAFAEETVGTITAMDNAKAEVTLDDGNTYAFGVPGCSNDTKCQVDMFKVGDKVRIIWDTIQDKRVGTEIAGVHQ